MLEDARKRSTVCRLAGIGRERLWAAVEGSTFGQLFGARSRSNESANHGVMTDLLRALETAVTNSRCHNAAAPITTGGRRIHQAMPDARLASLGVELRRYVESSAGYRWLTAEPEPEVIVIDLRETRTVGPIISVVDRTVRELAVGAPTSTVTGVAARVAAFGRERPVRAMSLIVFPVVLGALLTRALTQTVSVAEVTVHTFLIVFAALGLRSRKTLEDLRATRTAQLLVAVFEPPEPPASASRRDAADRAGPSADVDACDE